MNLFKKLFREVVLAIDSIDLEVIDIQYLSWPIISEHPWKFSGRFWNLCLLFKLDAIENAETQQSIHTAQKDDVLSLLVNVQGNISSTFWIVKNSF